jgi:hypothetical protein
MTGVDAPSRFPKQVMAGEACRVNANVSPVGKTTAHTPIIEFSECGANPINVQRSPIIAHGVSGLRGSDPGRGLVCGQRGRDVDHDVRLLTVSC